MGLVNERIRLLKKKTSAFGHFLRIKNYKDNSTYVMGLMSVFETLFNDTKFSKVNCYNF